MYFLQTVILAISIATNFLTALVVRKDHNDSTLKGFHLLHVERESAQTLAKHWDSNKETAWIWSFYWKPWLEVALKKPWFAGSSLTLSDDSLWNVYPYVFSHGF